MREDAEGGQEERGGSVRGGEGRKVREEEVRGREEGEGSRMRMQRVGKEGGEEQREESKGRVR